MPDGADDRRDSEARGGSGGCRRILYASPDDLIWVGESDGDKL